LEEECLQCRRFHRMRSPIHHGQAHVELDWHQVNALPPIFGGTGDRRPDLKPGVWPGHRQRMAPCR
jgi:hypothetical protein